MTTEEKIVAKALEMFNERGIEYVGLRELATTLGIRVGNITYYFPTKDDLVNRLSVDLTALNSQIVTEEANLSLYSFLDRFRQVFQNHVTYRCLFLSFVHLMEQNKVIAERYNGVEKRRYATLMANLRSLQTSGYLTSEADTGFLVSVIALTARFWISEARISFRHLSPSEQVRHYATMLGKLFVPYATAEGKAEVQRFLDELEEK
ncbi:TetR/AcrR family transcriptional regulator [Larkinella bovis]|uniref:TetR/AcrR family transcriptional regulator n=1 Tax=Larkinella bovis TaxID=683041 RepID=A0ABW0I7N7_9BACT